MDRCPVTNFANYRRDDSACPSEMASSGAHSRLRCQDFLRSDVDSRVFAFASYLAALDTEEAAAAQMSVLFPRASEYATTG